MVEEQIYKLRKLLEELEKIRGRHTELVSVYIPAEYNIQEIVNMLRQEYTLTENVKNKTVRNNVLGAIDKILQELKFYTKTPENGLIIFAGNVSEVEGETDIRVWTIEPPEPLRIKKYWCDQKFELEPLQDMVAEKELYGLIVLDNREATIGLLKGKKIEILRQIESIVPGKTIKGGQSSVRFQRVREGLINDWYKIIAENVRNYFSKFFLKGIIIGGPGPAKNDFYEGNYLLTELKKQVLGVKNVGYTDEQGLEELVERSQDILAEATIAKEKALLQKFFEELRKESGLVTYGKDNVKKALETGAVDIILVSEGLESESLAEKAKQYGTTVEIISKDTREGEQLYQLGGIAAILRWKL
ncbi:MAG: peptide chain release factor aRF-1 [Candidatus Aenigmatarchaeota archaeon]